MADVRRWRVDAGEAEPAVDVAAAGAAFAGCSVRWDRLRGGRSDGVTVVHVTTPRLELDVVPTRGMGIWKARADGVDLGWSSPVGGPVHPVWVDLSEPSGRGWTAGFDEFVVRCGLTSNGAPDFDGSGRLLYPLHGRIANLPAQDVTVDVDPGSGEIVVRGVVVEGGFGGPVLGLEAEVIVRPDDAGFRLRDRVVNRSAVPATAQLMYHVNLGPPLLGPGSRLVAPLAGMEPRDEAAAAGVDGWTECGPPGSMTAEQVFYCRLDADAAGGTGVLFRNAAATAALELSFPLEQLPYFTHWKNLVQEEDGYVIGLEPATNYPNPRTVEAAHGRVLTLGPGGDRIFDLTFAVHASAEAVAGAERRLSGERTP